MSTTQPVKTPGPRTALLRSVPGAGARPPGAIANAIRSSLRRPSILIALGWLVLVVLASALAGVLAPVDPMTQDLSNTYSLPTAEHLLGTDQLGRDILSRLLHGGGELLLVACIPVAVAYLIAVPSGLYVGYRGGTADRIADFIVNVLLAIPNLVIVLAIAVITGQNLFVMTVAAGVMLSGGVFRLVRATTSASRNLLYVDAARVTGVRVPLILARHILPNITAPLIVQAFLMYSGAFLFLSSLSFLGVGFDPQQPSWGRMVFDASSVLDRHPWMMAPIGVLLILTIFSLNYVGNSILDTLPTAKRLRLFTRPRRLRMPEEVVTRDLGTLPSASPSENRRGIMSGTNDVVLDVTDLTVAFAQEDGSWLRVVDGVSFQVRRGETFCLVGESGCGKTMTALALLGLLPEGGAAGGKVLLSGDDLIGMSEKRLHKVRGRRMSLISQEPMVALDPCFTVRSQLGEVIRSRGGGSRTSVDARVVDLLQQVGIADPEGVARSFPHQLSGGMAQRVCIAMALAGDPELIVADEPTTALDPTIQAEILDLLRDLQRSLGIAVVLVTHDLGVVADIGDDAAVMYAGQVVELSPVAELLADPKHPYSRGLLDAVPERARRGERLPTVPGIVPLPKDWPVSCRFAARCPFATEDCRSGPIPLEVRGPAHAARCIRIDEIDGPAAPHEARSTRTATKGAA